MKFASLLLATGLVATTLLGSTAADAQQSRDGQNRWVTVKNNSRFQTIVSIHAIPPPRAPQTNDPDLIPGQTIPPGGATRILIDNGRGACVFNIRLTTNTYPQRPDWISNNFNVCQRDTLSVAD